MLPLAGRRSQLAKSSDLLGFLVGPASQLVPLADEAFVTDVDEFAGSVCGRPAVKKADVRVGKHRDDAFQLRCLTIGKACENRGGGRRASVPVLVSFGETGKHHLRDASFAFAPSRQQLVGMLVGNALETAVCHVAVMGEHDGL